MRTLLLVGGVDDTAVAAKELGLRVLLLQHPTKITERQRQVADVVEVLDYTDWTLTAPVVTRLHQRWRIDQVVSLTEPGLDIAARARDLLGLDGTTYPVSRLFRDKLAMRRHLVRRDAEAVAAVPLRDFDDLRAFGVRHGYPFVVKPTAATASIGVFRVDDPSGHEAVWEQVCRLRGTRTDRVSTLLVLDDFLMEEYVHGREFSVETFSFAGRHVVVTITEKMTDPGHFAELGHAVPARLTEDAWDRVGECVCTFLDHLGFADGPCHTEVRLSGTRARIIESHHRYGGDAIPELVRAVYGIDLDRLAVGWPFRLVDPLPDSPAPRGGACVRTVVGPPGRVLSVEGVQEAARQPDVLAVRISARPGDGVRPLRDNWDRLGLVAVTGPTVAAAAERGARLVDEFIRIRIRDDRGAVHLARVAEVHQLTGAVG
ncbi:ATP-grasp domain-containing protein [Micromonospora sp. HUAS LYJ1]|uniref:ATP-grasp domain-containing protein n=1 Tax=Micromonospora sp. HUAS LYJ1 TaxID=3061626 RepID=UPI00267218B8|nr:ATP-grasp domain-containing protein [Micromonospora sp. HUAS LYJ1]WKU06936.1 ATP-grasp domain-containing protein [Micromonospora sp. HUAS LYJ1]